MNRRMSEEVSRLVQTSETDDFEKDVPHRSSVIRVIFLVEMPSGTIAAIAVKMDCSLRG